MKVHLYEFRWEDPETFVFQASHEKRYCYKPCHIGDPLSIAVTSPIHCAGSMREGVWKPCPTGEEGKRKCDGCRAREGSFVYTAFDGFNRDNITEEDLQNIAGEHFVYLAFFAKDLMKVGVCKAERKILRQLEQGAHATLFIAKTPDGIAARQIETLFRQQGLADKVKPSQKKDFLCPDMRDEEAKMALEEVLSHHTDALKGDYVHLQDFFLEKPEFCTWESCYHLQSVAESPKHFHPLSLEEEEAVSGRILAVKGNFVMLETPEEIVALGAKDLLGRVLDFTERPAGVQLNSALQNALF